MLFGLRVWASVILALYVSFWLQLDNAYWAGTSAAIVCQPQLGASLRKGWFRLVGTLVGATVAVVMAACFPQDRLAFLASLALWGGLCAVAATLLRNFASYAAALAGYTAAIIASDQLGAVGGLNGQAFTLAITRASEICIGIVSAGLILAVTDSGGGARQLATVIAEIGAAITDGFIRTLASGGAEFEQTQIVRRGLISRVAALEPLIDQSLGESATLRYYSPVLQDMVDGLFAALAGWRSVSVHLAGLPRPRAVDEAAPVLTQAQTETGLSAEPNTAQNWLGDPEAARTAYAALPAALERFPAQTPSSRLLADHTAAMFTGLSLALDALVVLIARYPHAPPETRHIRRPRIADWLPALINGGRAVVVIGFAEALWIVTQWSNGAFAMVFAFIVVVLLAPRADQAYAAGMNFTIGTLISAALAAVMGFAVLPQLDSFVGFSLALGLFFVPSAAGMTQSRWPLAFTALTANFIPLLAPANVEVYDTAAFYNNALAIVGGSGIAVLSFRLLPPLSPTYRTRRLLRLAARALRRLILRPTARIVDDWEGRGFARLTSLPNEATPLQGAQLLTALQAGARIIQLRRDIAPIGRRGELDAALAALVHGGVAAALARLASLDQALAVENAETALRSRAEILAILEALKQHEAYFATIAA